MDLLICVIRSSETNTSNDTSSHVESATAVTTTFIENAAVQERDLSTVDMVPTVTAELQSILDFLGKPYLVQDNLWATSDANNTTLYTLTVAPSAFSTPWLRKVEGFRYFRGTACFRLVVNANPFQQGKLLMHFLPVVNGRTTAGSTSSFTKTHNIALATKTQQPHIELDCRDTAAVFKVPYISPNLYFDLVDTTVDMGQLYITVLSALKTGATGPTDVSYSLFWWWEDCELVGPMVPQMGGTKKGRSKGTIQKISNPTDKEESGIVSGALRAVSDVASALSVVPFLSEIAAPVAWVADIGAGIASFFGWSKPGMDSRPGIMTKWFNFYTANAMGDDCLPTLAVFHNNKLELSTDGTHTAQDEMSLAYLLSVRAMVKTVNWDKTQVKGTSLYSKAVSPSLIYYLGSSTAINAKVVSWTAGPPVYYLSRFFSFYRGGLELVVKIVKTDYHTGRLQLTFTPGDGVATSPDLTTAQLALREVIDIREGNEVCLTMPYLINKPYQNVSDDIGTLDILVLSQLRMPETCADNVDLLIYWRAAPGFEFSVPCPRSSRNPFSPQMGGADELVCANIGDSKDTSDGCTMAARCIGERILSTKQLLNRYFISYRIATPTIANNQTLLFWPWAMGFTTQDTTSGLLSSNNIGGDTLSYLSHMYSFFRGSMRTQIRCSNSGVAGGEPIIMGCLQNTSGTQATLASGSATILGEAVLNWNDYTLGVAGPIGVAVCDSNSGSAGVRLPYYNQTEISRILYPDKTNNYIPYQYDQPQASLNSVGYQQFSSFNILRSCGDDFQFSYFVGCPAIVLSIA